MKRGSRAGQNTPPWEFAMAHPTDDLESALLALPGDDEPGSAVGKFAALAMAASAFPGLELI